MATVRVVQQPILGRRARPLCRLPVLTRDSIPGPLAGSHVDVVSDASFVAGAGPLRAADVYNGETFDANLTTPVGGPGIESGGGAWGRPH